MARLSSAEIVMMGLICGIDPGLDGALAFIDATTLRIAAMIGTPPMRLGKGTGSKREISPGSLVVMIDVEIHQKIGEPVIHTFLERVASSLQMGVTSAFQFGCSYGAIEGVIAALPWPIEYVTPAKWKRVLSVPAEKDDARGPPRLSVAGAGRGALDARRGVMNLLQVTGRAEAVLIALYGVRALRLVHAPKQVPADLFAVTGS